MPKLASFQHGFHKLIQNLFVMKSGSFLKAKAAAKGSKGKTPPPKGPPPKKPPPPPPGTKKKVSRHAKKVILWRNISLLGAFPTVGGVAAYIYISHRDEPEKERPPFIPYTYLRLRNKRFPWGDGNKTLFHNPKKNPLPNGYED